VAEVSSTVSEPYDSLQTGMAIYV